VSEPREGYTAVGRILKPHGLKGEIRVESFNPAAPNLQPGRTVFINSVRSKILRSRADRGGWIVQVTGFSGRDAVEGLRGVLIEARDADVRRDDDESYFIHELIGLRVITDEGEELGRITEVLQSGAADVYVIRDGEREVLIPAIGDVVDSIDVPAGEMRITPLAGLLDKSK
jgi:16S rRNA processing protein RimM